MDYHLPGDSLLELVRERQERIRAEAERQRLARAARARRSTTALWQAARRLKQAATLNSPSALAGQGRGGASRSR